MLLCKTFETNIVIESRGRVLPWFGRAIYSITKSRLKDLVCRHPEKTRREKWRYCKGCDYIDECSYSIACEPPVPTHLEGAFHEEPTRPFVICPFFPCPEVLSRGDSIRVKVTLIGNACGHSEEILDALGQAGKDTGIGPDNVRFRLDGISEITMRLIGRAMPSSLKDCSGYLPRVALGLTSPLRLRKRDRDSGQRNVIAEPSLYDLFNASATVIQNLFKLHEKPLDVDLAELRLAAEKTKAIETFFEVHEQSVFSTRQMEDMQDTYGKGRRTATENRSRFTRKTEFVTGGAVYKDVPLALLPWLTWGSKFHVGQHRVAGAGSWRLMMD